jgi:hypothetical protein
MRNLAAAAMAKLLDHFSGFDGLCCFQQGAGQRGKYEIWAD